MNKNLEFWDSVRAVPQEAIKKIPAGDLKGYSDINPVWRIKILTEKFGICGIGWYTEIKEHWTKEGAKNEILQFVRLHLFVKVDGEWSKPIEGVGGNKIINAWSSGQKSNDEALKMAETDALSVACKKLGIAADVYFAKDKTKYANAEPEPEKITIKQLQYFFALVKEKNVTSKQEDYLFELIKTYFKINSRKDWLVKDYNPFITWFKESSLTIENAIKFIEEMCRKKGKKLPENPDRVNDKDIGKLLDLAKVAGVTLDDILKFTKERLGKDNLELLSMDEFNLIHTKLINTDRKKMETDLPTDDIPSTQPAVPANLSKTKEA